MDLWLRTGQRHAQSHAGVRKGGSWEDGRGTQEAGLTFGADGANVCLFRVSSRTKAFDAVAKFRNTTVRVHDRLPLRPGAATATRPRRRRWFAARHGVVEEMLAQHSGSYTRAVAS